MRIVPRLVRQAAAYDRLLPYVLAATKTIPEAKLELSWLSEHFKNDRPALSRAVWLRSHHYPLQYLLKTQPFLGADILCRPGVLIPRWETEEWIGDFITLLRDNKRTSNLNVIDLCTGSGCIPISLATKLTDSNIIGVDISCKALRCFEAGIDYNINAIKSRSNTVSAVKGDVYKTDRLAQKVSGFTNGSTDLILANPPYISPESFLTETDRSVRRFEPHLALIGGVDFYKKIMEFAHVVKAKAAIFEVGDLQQVEYIRQFAKDNLHWESCFYYDSAGRPRSVAIWDGQQDFKFISRWQKHYSAVQPAQEADITGA